MTCKTHTDISETMMTMPDRLGVLFQAPKMDGEALIVQLLIFEHVSESI